MDFMKTAKAAAVLLAISIAAAFTINFLSPVGIALVGQWDTSKGVVTANAKNTIVHNDLEIGDLALGKQLYDSGRFVFVDARSRQDYEEGHIKGAVSLPVGEFDAQIEAFLERNPPETAIITYCSGRTCEDSHRLAQLLADLGYTQLKVLSDGFPGWKAEGYPIE